MASTRQERADHQVSFTGKNISITHFSEEGRAYNWTWTENQVILNENDKIWGFDNVFDTKSTNKCVYDKVIILKMSRVFLSIMRLFSIFLKVHYKFFFFDKILLKQNFGIVVESTE